MPVKQTRDPVDARTPRISALARLPIFMSLAGKRALLAGGGPAAAWKAELLSAAGAHVEVYAPQACEEMVQLAADPPVGPIIVNARAWLADDMLGAAIAVGAFE